MTIYLRSLKPHSYAILRFCERGKPENQKNAFFCIFFVKKFGERKMFDVPLHRDSKKDRARKRDVRDGREMVAMKQRIQSVTTQRKEKYDSRSYYTHRYVERTA